MRRHEIGDEAWDKIKDLLPGKAGDAGATARDNRVFINAVLWIARTGAPWRDLPERLGDWNNTFQRFNRWCKRGVWEGLLQTWQDPDLKCLMLDSTVIRAHQHAGGARKKRTPAMKPSAARAAGSAPSCISPSMPRDGQSNSSSRRARSMTSPRPNDCSPITGRTT